MKKRTLTLFIVLPWFLTGCARDGEIVLEAKPPPSEVWLTQETSRRVKDRSKRGEHPANG